MPASPGAPAVSARLWSLGILLIALGVAARIVGWDALLWLPRMAMDALRWIPDAAAHAIRSDPGTFGVIAIGVLLLILARVLGRRGN